MSAAYGKIPGEKKYLKVSYHGENCKKFINIQIII